MNLSVVSRSRIERKRAFSVSRSRIWRSCSAQRLRREDNSVDCPEASGNSNSGNATKHPFHGPGIVPRNHLRIKKNSDDLKHLIALRTKGLSRIAGAVLGFAFLRCGCGGGCLDDFDGRAIRGVGQARGGEPAARVRRPSRTTTTSSSLQMGSISWPLDGSRSRSTRWIRLMPRSAWRGMTNTSLSTMPSMAARTGWPMRSGGSSDLEAEGVVDAGDGEQLARAFIEGALGADDAWPREWLRWAGVPRASVRVTVTGRVVGAGRGA